MFLNYFGFTDEPFGATPEPRALYQSRTHREALASLKLGFLTNRGFTAMIAPPGMGKTTLLYRFLNDIRESARTVLLFDLNGQCEPRDLIHYLLRDLGITPAQSTAEMHEQLNRILLEEARANRKLVVVIDEAQNLSATVLETVRLLSNFETTRSKLMQIFLAGQPQLADKLTHPSLVQLRQRISTFCRLEPFSADETRSYIEHRIKLAGYMGEPLFTLTALDRITEASGGIPRVINTLCFNALSLCRALNRKQIDEAMVKEVIADQDLAPKPQPEPLALPAAPAAESSDSIDWDEYEPEPEPSQRRWIPFAAAIIIVSALSLFGISQLRAPNSAHASAPTATSSEANSDSPASESKAVQRSGPIEITVAPHQTIEDIAVQYLGGFTPSNLRRLKAFNPTIKNLNHIEAGQTLLIPPSSAATLAKNNATTGSARNLP